MIYAKVLFVCDRIQDTDISGFISVFDCFVSETDKLKIHKKDVQDVNCNLLGPLEKFLEKL